VNECRGQLRAAGQPAGPGPGAHNLRVTGGLEGGAQLELVHRSFYQLPDVG
jgi:hypothetical protein